MRLAGHRSVGEIGKRHWSIGAPPQGATGLASISLAAGGLLVAASWVTLQKLRTALIALQVGGRFADVALLVLAFAAIAPIWPSLRSLKLARQAKRAVAEGVLIAARTAAATARNLAWTAFGLYTVQAVVILATQFVIANDLAVGRTFFLLPLMGESLPLVLKAFWTNVYIFMIAEMLVLVWGLVIAVARLSPGGAGRPVRLIATVYIDGFRGLPAIINVYLIGFGISLTRLPLLKGLAPSTFAILALTLTSSAYVAEVYRAGIQSIHGSQVAAARSLGLSYLQSLRFVIVPQAVRRIIPQLLNNFISLQKDTALVSIIGALDAFSQAKIIASDRFNLSAVTTVALLFVIITIPQARLLDRMIERDRHRIQSGRS
jgi:polar amino acid transport system permease protein